MCAWKFVAVDGIWTSVCKDAARAAPPPKIMTTPL
jgi:hypothetical protein